jgi:putative nucleotidyltransferase with HDIG domain
MAQQLAQAFLQKALPRRWAHVQGVAARARSLALVLGADADLLEAAAWLHDIGHPPALALTSLHALDGARYLRDGQHADAMLAGWSHITPAPSSKPENADSPTSCAGRIAARRGR